jgi:hypothetical protein
MHTPVQQEMLPEPHFLLLQLLKTPPQQQP